MGIIDNFMFADSDLMVTETFGEAGGVIILAAGLDDLRAFADNFCLGFFTGTHNGNMPGTVAIGIGIGNHDQTALVSNFLCG